VRSIKLMFVSCALMSAFGFAEPHIRAGEKSLNLSVGQLAL
jgi:hypothetical protein